MDFGNKYTCKHCSVRFYDLKKLPPACPTCGIEHIIVPLIAPVKPRRYRPA